MDNNLIVYCKNPVIWPQKDNASPAIAGDILPFNKTTVNPVHTYAMIVKMSNLIAAQRSKTDDKNSHVPLRSIYS